MSKDMFAESQQTPLMKGPRTPSMTPTRSVNRRSSVKNRPSATPSMAGMSDTELWAQYGLYPQDGLNPQESIKPFSPVYSDQSTHNQTQSSLKSEQSNTKDKKESCTLLSKCGTGLKLFCVMVLSAFLGAFCHACIQDYFVKHSCSSPMQIAQDIQVDRPVYQAAHSLELENSVLRLSEEIEHLKDRFRMLKENVGSEIISSPQKGILEELLTADLACSGNLGSVVATPDTTTVTVPVTVTVWILSFHVQVKHRNPQTTIEGLIQEVGDCWPFQGSQGRLVLKLHWRSLVSGVSISHIPPSISSTGDVSSAPRLFQVLAHQQENDLENGQILGEFEYKTSGPWRQTFPLKPSNSKEELFNIIEFRFLKNHGHPNYTCIYRVHVHGKTP